MPQITIATARTVALHDLAAFYVRCKDAYYNSGEPLVDDATFDAIEGILRERAPEHVVLHAVGAGCGHDGRGCVHDGGGGSDEEFVTTSGRTVTLPRWMGSQNKIYPDAAGAKAFRAWRKRVARDCAGEETANVATPKLDGLSAIVVVTTTGVQLLSRGDGAVAQDWTHHYPHLSPATVAAIDGLRSVVPYQATSRIVLRMEAVMSRRSFEANRVARNWNKTPRNVVSGLLNAKQRSDDLVLIDLVAFEVIEPPGLRPSVQLERLDEWGVGHVGHLCTGDHRLCVDAQVLPNDFDMAELEPLFWKYRAEASYDTDGVVVVADFSPSEPPTHGNPPHAFAFKMRVEDASQLGETTVRTVEWKPSRHGQWKPTIVVTPVVIGNVTVSRATGFHAKYIQDNGIGSGARVCVRRCGDVIPNVIATLVPSTDVVMPPSDISAWSASGVDMAVRPACPPVWQALSPCDDDALRSAHRAIRVQQLTHFFKALKVRAMSARTLEKFVEHDFTDPFAILSIDAAQIAQWPGFASKSSEVLTNGMRRAVRGATALEWLQAADPFGRGFAKKKLELLLRRVPQLFDVSTNEACASSAASGKLYTRLLETPGIQRRTADALMSTRADFCAYWTSLVKYAHAVGVQDNLQLQVPPHNNKPDEPRSSNRLAQWHVVFTGFRDEELAVRLRNEGAHIATSMSKKVNVIVRKNEHATNKKIERALTDDAVRVLTCDDVRTLLDG